MGILISIAAVFTFFSLLGLAERLVPGQILDRLSESIFGGEEDEN